MGERGADERGSQFSSEMSSASGKVKTSCKEIKKLSVEAFSTTMLSNEAQHLRSMCYKKGRTVANCLSASVSKCNTGIGSCVSNYVSYLKAMSTTL